MIDTNYYRENLRCQIRSELQFVLGALVFCLLSLAYIVFYPKCAWTPIAVALAVVSIVVGLAVSDNIRANKRKLRELGEE